MRDTMRSAQDAAKKNPTRKQHRPIQINEGQYAAAKAAARSLEAQQRQIMHATSAPRAPKGTKKYDHKPCTRPRPTPNKNSSEHRPISLSIVQAREAATRLRSSVVVAGKRFSRSISMRGLVSSGNALLPIPTQPLHTASNERTAAQAKTYLPKPKASKTRLALRAKWKSFRAKASRGKSTPQIEQPLLPRPQVTILPTRTKPAPLLHRQTLSDPQPIRHTRDESDATTVTRFSDFIRAASPRPKMPALHTHSNHSWRGLHMHSPRVFAKRPPSAESDLSFADAGNPDDMLACQMCGETNPEKIERYGVCKACAREAEDRVASPVPVKPKTSPIKDRWEGRLNRDTTYTLPGDPWGEVDKPRETSFYSLSEYGTDVGGYEIPKLRSVTPDLDARLLDGEETAARLASPEWALGVQGHGRSSDAASVASSRTATPAFGIRSDSPAERFHDDSLSTIFRSASPATFLRSESPSERFREGVAPAVSRKASLSKLAHTETRVVNAAGAGRSLLRSPSSASSRISWDSRDSITALYEAAGFLYPRSKPPAPPAKTGECSTGVRGAKQKAKVLDRSDMSTTKSEQQQQCEVQPLRDSFFAANSDPLGKLEKGDFATQHFNWI